MPPLLWPGGWGKVRTDSATDRLPSHSASTAAPRAQPNAQPSAQRTAILCISHGVQLRPLLPKARPLSGAHARGVLREQPLHHTSASGRTIMGAVLAGTHISGQQSVAAAEGRRLLSAAETCCAGGLTQLVSRHTCASGNNSSTKAPLFNSWGCCPLGLRPAVVLAPTPHLRPPAPNAENNPCRTNKNAANQAAKGAASLAGPPFAVALFDLLRTE